MIRFIARRTTTGKLTIGLVLMPADVAKLLGGDPELIKLHNLDAENPIIDDIIVFAFRDMQEFKKAMQAAGFELRLTLAEETAKPSERGDKQRFAAPPAWKIPEN